MIFREAMYLGDGSKLLSEVAFLIAKKGSP
jgi:hypothetical protein